jgi:hypothetical protein
MQREQIRQAESLQDIWLTGSDLEPLHLTKLYGAEVIKPFIF